MWFMISVFAPSIAVMICCVACCSVNSPPLSFFYASYANFAALIAVAGSNRAVCVAGCAAAGACPQVSDIRTTLTTAAEDPSRALECILTFIDLPYGWRRDGVAGESIHGWPCQTALAT
jgi:hypothetical protein